MSLRSADVERVVGFVWDVLVGGPIEPAASNAPGAEAAERLAAAVAFDGGMKGRVIFECPLTLARAAAARLLGEPEHALDLDRVEDAMAELVNVVAGNLKSLLPAPCRLGTPVTRTLDAGEPSERAGCRLIFRAGAETFVLAYPGSSA